LPLRSGEIGILAQETDRTERARFIGGVGVVGARNHQDRNGGTFRVEEGNAGVPDSAGHFQVESDEGQVRRIGRSLGCCRKGASLYDPGAGDDGRKGHRKCLSEQRMVISDEDSGIQGFSLLSRGMSMASTTSA
jgi:hypothetical protein